MEIRAAEISAILKNQIANFGTEADVAEVGTVLSIGDGIARVYGLDTVQAAILIEKLGIFREEIARRDRIARRYHEDLAAVVVVPTVACDRTSVWAQYTIRLKAGNRDAVVAELKTQGIPTGIYYPKPLHQQEAYRHFPVGGGGLAVSEQAAAEVLSLPMHAYLDERTQDRIVAAVHRALDG